MIVGGTVRTQHWQHSLKKAAAIVVLVLYVVTFASCGMPAKYSIEDLQNIMVGGLDVHDDKIMLTVLVDTMQKGAEAGKEKTGTMVYIAEGDTVFDAKRKLHLMTEKHITWDQLKYIIIGEEAARQGLSRYLNFFIENEENKFSHQLLIAKGTAATTFIQQTNTDMTSLSDFLQSLTVEASQTGLSSEITLLEYAISQERPWTSLWIPSVTQIPDPVATQNTEENQPYIIRLSGYAIFSGDMLVGFLEQDSARALSFVHNDVDSTALTTTDQEGHNVSLEVIQSKAEIKPNENALSAKISLNIKLNLVEYFGNIEVNEQYISNLEQKVDSMLEKQILTMIKIVQDRDTDVLMLGDTFYHKYPEKWKKFKNEWVSIFPKVVFTVEVTSSIQCSYNLLDPPKEQGGK